MDVVDPPAAVPDEQEPGGSSRRGLTPRRVVGAGAAVAVLALLVGGVVYAVRDSDPATTSLPTGVPSTAAAAVPRAGATLFGVSVPRGGAGSASTVVQRIRQDYGQLPVARVFSSGPPPRTWDADPTLAALGTGTAVVYSFKDDPVAAARGDDDAAVTAFLASRPAGTKVWVSYFHEPEDEVRKGTFTAQQFRDATAHLAPVIRAAGGVPTTILMEYTLQDAAKRDWHDYYSPAVDVLAWDAYNTAVKRSTPAYKPVDAILGHVLDIARETGKPFGIAEFGSTCIPSDPECTGRAAWVSALGDAVRRDGAVFATYFDQAGVNGDGGDYSLSDPPSRSAYRLLVDQ